MTIRSKLLLYILPPMVAFVAIISSLVYFHMQRQIVADFQEILKATVVTTAHLIKGDDSLWLHQHQDDPQILQHPTYRRYNQLLSSIRTQLPITNLYTVRIKPVQKEQSVLTDQPPSNTNKPYDGIDPSLAYRQVLVMDADSTTRPGEVDFSESGEHSIYHSREPLITSVYTARRTGEKMMSGYAPIIDSNNQVTALIAADISLSLINERLSRAMAIILVCAAVTILLVVISVYFIASNISKPVLTLKNSALAIAAGEHYEKILVSGPKEISELANTLNTMGECLQENLYRLKEGSLLRERLYGEYECARLLQHQMLQEVVDGLQHPGLSFQMIQVASTGSPRGLLLNTQSTSKELRLALSEATSSGFHPIYELLKQTTSPHSPISLTVTFSADCHELSYSATNMPSPIVWSAQQNALRPLEHSTSPVEPGDLILLFNHGFSKLFADSDMLDAWIARTLRHFARDGLAPCVDMLRNQLEFITKRQHIDHDVNIICIRRKEARG